MIPRMIRWLAWALAALAIPLLGWWAVNQVDESPTPEAARLAEPFADSLGDDENGWIFLLGLNAPEGDDPTKAGRARLDAHEARMAQRPMSGQAGAHGGHPNRLQVLPPDTERFGVDGWCAPAVEDCIDWARNNEQMLLALAAEHATVLRRYMTAVDLQRFEEQATPAMDAPVIDFEVAALERALIALHLGGEEHRALAVSRLESRAAFWRRLVAQSRSMQLRQHASHHLAQTRRLFDQAMNRPWFDAASYPADSFPALLEEPGEEELDWTDQVRHELQGFDNTLSGLAIGSFGAWLRCREEEADGCAGTWLMGQAYAHQATLNLRAPVDLWVMDALHAPLPELDSVAARGQALFDRTNPLPDDTWALIKGFLYNFTGRTLVTISIPSLDFVRREHDREALRRLLAAKFGALREGVGEWAMFDYLDSLPASLRDPATGGPITWDPLRRELLYRLSEAGGGDGFLRLQVGRPARAERAVEVCDRSWYFSLSIAHPGAGGLEELEMVAACGGQSTGEAWIRAAPDDESATAFWQVTAGPAIEHPDAEDEEFSRSLPLSVYFDRGAERRFVPLQVFAGGNGMYVELRDSEDFLHQGEVKPAPYPLVALRFRDLSPREAGIALRDALAAGGGPRIEGVELLGEGPLLSAERDMPVVEALLWLLEAQDAGADEARLFLRENQDGTFELRRWEQE